MNKFCRSNNVTARYGGDEFFWCCLKQRLRGLYIAERIREEMASQTFQHKGKDFNVTVSFGIAEFDSKLTKNPADLMKVADQAFYKAKHEVRNLTIVVTP
jgi:diguanylate cyclase (GGDEF)-like protein